MGSNELPQTTTIEPIVLPAGVKAAAVPGQKIFDGKVFPLILVPEFDEAKRWETWLKENIPLLKSLLLKFGAILFRGFTINSGQGFEDFCKTFEYVEFPFSGNFANRTPIVGNVYTANDSIGRTMPFHHELVHLPESPTAIFFYCELPSQTAGETPIVLSNVVYREMAEKEPEFISRLHREDIAAIRVMPEEDDKDSYLGTSWKSSFKVNTREDAERVAKETGHWDLEWLPNGSLRAKTRPVPGLRVERKTGQVVFFTYLHTAYFGLDDRHNTDPKKSAIFLNGDTMPERAMDVMYKSMWGNSVQLKWEAGDIMLLDNMQVQHSRNDFRGPRKVLVSMYKEKESRLV